MLMLHTQASRRGFTVVELLIVIVVIAVLAAITVVAYNGISQRAQNAAIIDAAAKTKRLIQAYNAQEGKYPLGPAAVAACVTTDTGCYDGTTSRSALASFGTNMASIGTLPRSVPKPGSDRYGIYVQYWGSAAPSPVYLVYFLQGINQSCGLSGVLNASANGYSAVGYSSGNVSSSGKTHCIVEVPL